jgi:hypothetical protein
MSLYYAVVIPANGPAHVLEFASADEAAALATSGKAGQDDQIFFFHGSRLQVTLPPFRYLVTESKRLIPLFDSPRPEGFDDSGYVGAADVVDLTYAKCVADIKAVADVAIVQDDADDSDQEQVLPGKSN